MKQPSYVALVLLIGAADAWAQGTGPSKKYLMSFQACTNCGSATAFQTYLAESDSGTNWTLVPGFTNYPAGVPDVIRRDDVLYIYTPGEVRRYRFTVGTWESPVSVSLSDTNGFVDPSMILDGQGRLVMFYLPGIFGQDPAQCASGETQCVREIRSATEVEGSDGTSFTTEPSNRVTITIGNPGSASDPDIFWDGDEYVLYVSRGTSIQVYTSPSLHGSYTQVSALPGGLLSTNGGVSCGIAFPKQTQFWTFVHTTDGTIRRAAHGTVQSNLANAAFAVIATNTDFGLASTYTLQSPGIALNRPASDLTEAAELNAVMSGTNEIVSFFSATTRVYALQCATNLDGLSWQDLQTNMPGLGATLTLTTAQENAACYYRVVGVGQ